MTNEVKTIVDQFKAAELKKLAKLEFALVDIDPDSEKLQWINDDGILEMTDQGDRAKIAAEIKEAFGLDREAKSTQDELRQGVEQATAYVRYDRVNVDYGAVNEAIGALILSTKQVNEQQITWLLKKPDCNNNGSFKKPAGVTKPTRQMQRGRGRRLDNDAPKQPVDIGPTKSRWVADSDSDSETSSSRTSQITQIQSRRQSVKSNVSMGTFLKRFNDRDDNTSDISAIVARKQPATAAAPRPLGKKRSADLKPTPGFDLDAIYQVSFLFVKF